MTTATKRRKAKTAPQPEPQPRAFRIPRRYTAGQLVTLHRMCKAEPLRLTVDEFAGATFTSATWLAWFFEKLTEKINRHEPARGKGNAAARRVNAHKDRVAECKWCGTKTGERRKEFCDPECRRCYFS
mgnify:CR=1 FL=1